MQKGIMPGVCAAAVFLGAIGPAGADDAKPLYPAMAQIEQYRMASASEEIALARSAAPASISGEAEVLTLGDKGYETAVTGKNGFICLVERSWAKMSLTTPSSGIPSCVRRYATTPPQRAPSFRAISSEQGGFSPASQRPPCSTTPSPR